MYMTKVADLVGKKSSNLPTGERIGYVRYRPMVLGECTHTCVYIKLGG